jgi:glycosyltransferase involved in cell wall biosynthesis
MPKVSVIIPCYNSARYLGQAIESVQAQQYTDYEIIVVDDGSTDDTAQVAARYADKVRYLYQNNQGLPGTRNSGVAVSSGEYLAFLDSDDLFLPHKLRVQVAALDAAPELSLVASGYQYINQDNRVLGDERPWKGRPCTDLASILRGGLTAVHATLLRRTSFDRIGGFDPSFRYAEDMDFWYRLSLSDGIITWAPSIVCQYRIHPNNMSRKIAVHYRWARTALDKVFRHPRLPEPIRNQSGQFYALVYLGEAGRLYAGQDAVAAQQALTAALDLDPQLGSERLECLTDAMISWSRTVWRSDLRDILTYVLDNLPSHSALPSDLTPRISLKRNKALFYDAFIAGDSAVVCSQWIKIARQELNWLRNRGSWSILCRSLARGLWRARGVEWAAVARS